MYATLNLEIIEHRNPKVARLIGRDEWGRIVKEFMPYKLDYSFANGVGSRGVNRHYVIPEGVYWVEEHVSRRCTRSYYIRSKGGDITEIPREEATACLPRLERPAKEDSVFPFSRPLKSGLRGPSTPSRKST